MKTFVGIDYHKSYSYGMILDPSGKTLRHGRFENSPESLGQFLSSYAGADCSAVLEATRNWTLMHDWLEEQVGSVTLAHPLKVRAIAEARIKTDKIDAATLAHLLRCDLIPAAHVCSPAARVLKNLLRHRMFLVAMRTAVKNRIHVLMDRHPQLQARRPATDLFVAAHLQWLKGLELADDERHVLDGELSLLEHLSERIKESEQWLKHAGQADPRVKRLMTMPGIGRFLAMLIVSEIDEVNRFATPAKLHAYAGLIPSTRSSGGKDLAWPDQQSGQPLPALGDGGSSLARASQRCVDPAVLREPRTEDRNQQGKSGDGAAAVDHRLSNLKGEP